MRAASASSVSARAEASGPSRSSSRPRLERTGRCSGGRVRKPRSSIRARVRDAVWASSQARPPRRGATGDEELARADRAAVVPTPARRRAQGGDVEIAAGEGLERPSSVRQHGVQRRVQVDLEPPAIAEVVGRSTPARSRSRGSPLSEARSGSSSSGPVPATAIASAE